MREWSAPVIVIEQSTQRELDDSMAVEEPLEIQVRIRRGRQTIRRSISVTMRTPGDDGELATGFLLTEGIIGKLGDIVSLDFCGRPDPDTGLRNVILAELDPGVEIDLKKLERHFYTSSSCGVCGKSSIEAVRVAHSPLGEPTPMISSEELTLLPRKLLEAQLVFASTGGLHAAALFDTAGRLVLLREDIGRHNAVDKVIGSAMAAGLCLGQHLILVSGRAGFELIQKALVAGIPFLAAIGAPSSLAVRLARSSGMTLVGFLREQRFTVYSAAERLVQR
jgi:FdhD protein